jgi:hypothetical protein
MLWIVLTYVNKRTLFNSDRRYNGKSCPCLPLVALDLPSLSGRNSFCSQDLRRLANAAGHPAVDGQHLACDVCRRWAGQEQHRIGYVGWLT